LEGTVEEDMIVDLLKSSSRDDELYNLGAHIEIFYDSSQPRMAIFNPQNQSNNTQRTKIQHNEPQNERASSI
jgi:hypothetical protein